VGATTVCRWIATKTNAGNVPTLTLNRDLGFIDEPAVVTLWPQLSD
jgi:hypothetical protein